MTLPPASGNVVNATPVAAGAVGAWPWFGYDTRNSRYNDREKIINADNVGGLVERWHIDGIKGVSSTPAVKDGIVYYPDFSGFVHAVDQKTGA